MTRVCAWAVLLTFIVAAPALAGDVDALDAENGFREARFGTSLERLDGFELLSENGAAGTKLYIRSDESLELGDARLDGVTYGFHADELYFVAIFTSGRTNTRAVLAAFEAAYGPGADVSGDAVEFVWQGARVALHFREDPATGVGMAAFTSLPMDARIKASRNTVPANAAN